MVKEAAKLIFNKELIAYSKDGVLPTVHDDAVDFVEYMLKSGNLTRPGVYVGATVPIAPTLYLSSPPSHQQPLKLTVARDEPREESDRSPIAMCGGTFTPRH